MEIERKIVLVVDDIIPSLKTTGKLLESTFTVCLAKSTDVASKILRANRVSLILLDIAMPEMSGIQYLEQLRQTERYRDIPVIFVTSHATKETFTEAIDSGAKDFIVKPVQQDVLIKKINTVLGDQSSEKASRMLMRQMLIDLQKSCKKGMETRAGALIRQIRHKQLNPVTDARIAKICDLVSLASYKTAIGEIRSLIGSDFGGYHPQGRRGDRAPADRPALTWGNGEAGPGPLESPPLFR
jgi:CheY-like chemotaxis protein